MAAGCNCSNPRCPCYKGKQDKAGEQQAPGPDAPSTQSTNGSNHGGSPMTTAETPALNGANIEVTNTPTLRNYYENDKGAMTTLAESLTSLARDMEEHAAGQEHSIGWMTSDEFDQETIGHATGIQEETVGIAKIIADVAAKVQEKVGRLDAAVQHSLNRHTAIEDAVSGGAAKSTASYMGS